MHNNNDGGNGGRPQQQFESVLKSLSNIEYVDVGICGIGLGLGLMGCYISLKKPSYPCNSSHSHPYLSKLPPRHHAPLIK